MIVPEKTSSDGRGFFLSVSFTGKGWPICSRSSHQSLAQSTDRIGLPSRIFDKSSDHFFSVSIKSHLQIFVKEYSPALGIMPIQFV